jgi:hypothetical protein
MTENQLSESNHVALQRANPTITAPTACAGNAR